MWASRESKVASCELAESEVHLHEEGFPQQHKRKLTLASARSASLRKHCGAWEFLQETEAPAG